jgi:voltage-gated potassium channel
MRGKVAGTTVTAMTPDSPAHLDRLARLRASHSYWAVLGAIFVAFFLAALLPDTSWAASTILLVGAATLLIAIWTAGWTMTERTFPIALATAAIACAVLNLFWRDEALTATLGIVGGLLTITIAVVIAAGAIAQQEVNSRSVAGAICVYVLLGMVFMFIYGTLAAIGKAPFFAQGIDGTRPLRLYFSYVTLATLGYGDYTPAQNLGRALAVLEALAGQLYLVTVVAVVVSRLGRPGRGSFIRQEERDDGPHK